MAELADERGGLAATEARATSPEKQLQLETYAEALARPSRSPARRDADDAFVRELRERFGVTGDEHAMPCSTSCCGAATAFAAHLGDVPAGHRVVRGDARRA